MLKIKENAENKERNLQFSKKTRQQPNLSTMLKCYKQAMIASLASLMIGNTKEAELFLKVGLSGGNINKATDIEEKNAYWNH